MSLLKKLPKWGSPHQTLVLLKPDGYKKDLLPELLIRLRTRGLRVVEIHTMELSKSDVDLLYGKYGKKAFYGALVRFMRSGPCFVLRVSGRNAVRMVREVIGIGDYPYPETTFRGYHGTSVRRNVVHASDSSEVASGELNWFFGACKN